MVMSCCYVAFAIAARFSVKRAGDVHPYAKRRSMADAHIPAASAPQVACDASNLVLDPHRMHAARCPKHRPRYMCTAPTYNAYDPGAFAVACTWEPPALFRGLQQAAGSARVAHRPGPVRYRFDRGLLQLIIIKEWRLVWEEVEQCEP